MSTRYDFTKGAAALAHAVTQDEAKAAGIDAKPRKPRPPKPPAPKCATCGTKLAPQEAKDGTKCADCLNKEIEQAESAPKPPMTPKPKPEPRPICTKTKKDGKPCTARCMEGVDYCTDHRAPIAHLKPEEQEALTRWLADGDGKLEDRLVEAWGWGQVQVFIRKALLKSGGAK